MSKDKLFIGNGKPKKFDNGGWTVNAFLNVTDLCKYFTEYGFKDKYGNDSIKIKISPYKEDSSKVYIEVDTWKPKRDTQTADSADSKTINPFNGQNNGIENAQADEYGLPPVDTDSDTIPF